MSMRRRDEWSMMKRARTERSGQSLLEYGVLVAAVTTALLVMSDYIHRAYTARADTIEDELNGQQ